MRAVASQESPRASNSVHLSMNGAFETLLKKLAKADDRSPSSMVRWLITQEARRRGYALAPELVRET